MFATKRHFLTATLVLMIVAASSFATPIYIHDKPTQTISGFRSSPPYGWTYSFDIGFSALELNVQLRIRLTGFDPGSALEQIWESGIENMWTRKFDIVDGAFHYHVNFDAAFYHSSMGGSIHHIVTVIDGQGRGNMTNWYTICDWGSQYNGAFAAHETGHMFGLYDEYSGGAVYPSAPIIDYTSIMGSLDGISYERHYLPFLNWLQQTTPWRLLYLDDYDQDWVNPAIPEPATWLLLALGAILQRKMKNRKSLR